MAKPPKGAWKYLLTHGVKSLTAHPKAYPTMVIITAGIIAITHLLAPEKNLHGKIDINDLLIYLAMITLPNLFLCVYWTYGLLFGFTNIDWPRLAVDTIRYTVATSIGILGLGASLAIAYLPVWVLWSFSAVVQLHSSNPIIVAIIALCLYLLGLIPGLYIMTRLTFLSVIALAQSCIAPKQSWNVSRGWVRDLFVSLTIVFFVGMCVAPLLKLIGPSADFLLVNIIVNIIGVCSSLICCTIMVTAYKKAAQEEPQPVPASVASE